MKTIIEKIWDSLAVEHKEGFPAILAIDLQLVRESFLYLLLHRTLATVDHNVPTKQEESTIQNPISRHQIEMIRQFALFLTLLEG